MSEDFNKFAGEELCAEGYNDTAYVQMSVIKVVL